MGPTETGSGMELFWKAGPNVLSQILRADRTFPRGSWNFFQIWTPGLSQFRNRGLQIPSAKPTTYYLYDSTYICDLALLTLDYRSFWVTYTWWVVTFVFCAEVRLSLINLGFFPFLGFHTCFHRLTQSVKNHWRATANLRAGQISASAASPKWGHRPPDWSANAPGCFWETHPPHPSEDSPPKKNMLFVAWNVTKQKTKKKQILRGTLTARCALQLHHLESLFLRPPTCQSVQRFHPAKTSFPCCDVAKRWDQVAVGFQYLAKENVLPLNTFTELKGQWPSSDQDQFLLL